MAEPKIKQLALKNITVDPALQMRAKGSNPVTVDEYAEAMLKGDEFPPLVVYHDKGGTMWLADGFTRYAAATKAEFKTHATEIRTGTRKDAMLHSARANRTNGMRMTNADKNRAVAQLLTEFDDMPNAQIADIIGVSDTLVAAVKKRLKRIKDGLSVKLPGSAKEKEDTPDEDDILDGVQIAHAPPEKCLKVVASVVKLLHRSQEMLSGLMATPYAQVLKNASQSVTGGELNKTGEIHKKGEWGSIVLGLPAWSNQAMDDLLQLCGVLKLALGRVEEIAEQADGERMTPEEIKQFGESLRNPDDTVQI